jgi:hypothetical protein
MAESATFDGDQKLIIINNGEDEIDVQRDIYSAWKRWLIEQRSYGLTSNYLQALRTIGGDPISVTEVVSPYFFLLNGWRIRPYEGDHFLQVEGNIFVEGGGSPFVATVGSYNVVVSVSTSSKSITTTVSASGSGLTQQENDQLFSIPSEAVIANAVWDGLLSQHTSAGTAGEIINKIKRLAALIPGTV